MEFEHSAFQEMLSLGCTNKKNVIATFQAYLNLCEERKFWDVQFHNLKNENIVYLTAKEKKNDPYCNLYLIIPSKESINLGKLCSIQKQMCELHPHSEFKVILKDPDSTCTQYKLTKGLSILSLEVAKERKLSMEKHNYLQNEFNKMKQDLYTEVKHKLYENNSLQ
uniref:tRNA-splicing endonuclease subunit Sen15 domain-containing protein n=1 Tax=Clastoptera arizonana TaxID=38151 RepID=A0A1B6C108_9HEMI